jgi:hypothetical protein
MPVIGSLSPNTKVAMALEQLIGTLEALADRKPPVVNVEAPPRPSSWVFTVNRDAQGRFKSIDARPKFG